MSGHRRTIIVGLVLAGLYGMAASCAAGSDNSSTPGTGGEGGQVRNCGPEVCDGLDNDCDGLVDEDCACHNGEEQGCYTGSPHTVGIGECKRGVQQCTDNRWGACVGETVERSEICDRLDNDCDGIIDEGCGTGGQGAGTGVGGQVGSGGAGGMYGQADFADNRASSFESMLVPMPADPAGASVMTVDFRWEAMTGRPPLFDLTVRLARLDDAIAQVFSMRGRPLVRIGTRAEPLQPDVDYRIEIVQRSSTVQSRIVRTDDGAVVIESPSIELPNAGGAMVELVTPTEGSRVRLDQPALR